MPASVVARHRRRVVASAALAGRRTLGFRQAEVEHLDGAVGADLDVARLEIAMDDALLVRGVERVGDLPRDAERLVERSAALPDPLGQRRPLDQLHDEVVGRRRRRACRCSDG